MLRVAAAQLGLSLGDVGGNVQAVADAARASAGSVDVLLTPELAVQGYGLSPERTRELAESRDGPSLAQLRQTARECSVALAVGFAEAGDGGRVYNSLAFVSAEGELLRVYRKAHLWGPEERQCFSPAPTSDCEPLEYRGWRLGLLICYDVEFPEPARALALAGADALLVATACGVTDQCLPQRAMVQVRAKENQLAVVYCNHAAAAAAATEDATTSWAGGSCVVGADGFELAAAPGAERALLTATLDKATAAHASERNPYLADRRRDYPISLS